MSQGGGALCKPPHLLIVYDLCLWNEASWTLLSLITVHVFRNLSKPRKSTHITMWNCLRMGEWTIRPVRGCHKKGVPLVFALKLAIQGRDWVALWTFEMDAKLAMLGCWRARLFWGGRCSFHPIGERQREGHLTGTVLAWHDTAIARMLREIRVSWQSLRH